MSTEAAGNPPEPAPSGPPGPDPGRARLRQTFDAVAERYDGIRPDYPPELVAELIRLADLGRGDRVLEIGCGTGQLTVPLAAAGLRVTAVELGPALAAVAQRRLVPYPDARVTVGAFEDVPVAEAAFDLVVAATSFHWIDEAVRVEKSARALRPGGSLAVVDTHHVAGGSEEFFRDVQACYEAWDPSTPPGCGCPLRTTSRPRVAISTAHRTSSSRTCGGTSGTSGTRRPGTGRSCSPTPTISRCRSSGATACSAASSR